MKRMGSIERWVNWTEDTTLKPYLNIFLAFLKCHKDRWRLVHVIYSNHLHPVLIQKNELLTSNHVDFVLIWVLEEVKARSCRGIRGILKVLTVHDIQVLRLHLPKDSKHLVVRRFEISLEIPVLKFDWHFRYHNIGYFQLEFLFLQMWVGWTSWPVQFA